jgi:hypothetical protein
MSSSFLVQLEGVTAPTPLMVKPAANAFRRLREIVRLGCGSDFLAKCGDIFRPADFVSGKSGVANRSWHKTGRAFDYDQTSPVIVIVSEPYNGKQYFRTWLKCTNEGGDCILRTVHDYRGYQVTGRLFDFTAAAEAQGFKRITAWAGWERPKNYNLREFWHYQFDEGLTWAAAMAMLSADSGDRTDARSISTVGLNDRDSNTGGMVTKIQTACVLAGVLPQSEIDGVFGEKTRNAVQALQRLLGLEPDGLVGPKTLAAMRLV